VLTLVHVSLCHWLWNFFKKKYIYFKKKINLTANNKVTRVQELTFILNPNENLTEGTKTRLKKQLKVLKQSIF